MSRLLARSWRVARSAVPESWDRLPSDAANPLHPSLRQTSANRRSPELGGAMRCPAWRPQSLGGTLGGALPTDAGSPVRLPEPPTRGGPVREATMGDAYDLLVEGPVTPVSQRIWFNGPAARSCSSPSPRGGVAAPLPTTASPLPPPTLVPPAPRPAPPRAPLLGASCARHTPPAGEPAGPSRAGPAGRR